MNKNWKRKLRIENPKFILAIVVALFTILVFTISSLRYMDFLDLNWDMGINMQLLWTNTHGYLLFETADFETSGIRSFLQINSAYVAIPLSYLYRQFPSAYTLLLIQAIGISLSAIPLYYYSNLRLKNPNLTLLIVIFFLSCFAVISGVFYDFHWESFIPLEFFTFIFLIARRKYFLGAGLIVLGTVTLEVFPFLAASYLLYTLFFPRDALPNPVLENSNLTRDRLTYLFLLIFSGIMYYAVMYIGGVLIPGFVGSPVTAVTSTHSISYLFNFGINGSNLLHSTDYWLLLLMSMGFVPLIKPKSLIVIIPWMYWSSVAFPQYYTTQFGVQYGILATIVLMIPFIEGTMVLQHKDKLSEPNSLYIFLGPILLLIIGSVLFNYAIFVNHAYLLEFSLLFGAVGIITISILTLNPKVLFSFRKRYSNSKLAKKSLHLFLIIAIVASVFIGPLNPLNAMPEGTGGYSISYNVNPSYQYTTQITNITGHNSTVLSTDNLFVYVANNPNAYSFFWYHKNYSSDQYFPFNGDNMPEYLLLDTSMMFTVPHYFYNSAFNSTNYGLRLEISNNAYPGNIYLFEIGYRGNTTIEGA